MSYSMEFAILSVLTNRLTLCFLVLLYRVIQINQAFAKFNGKSKQKSAFIIRNLTITGVDPEICCLVCIR